MHVKIVKMRKDGVELPSRAARNGVAHRGQLVILDVTDQGLRRPSKVARLMQVEVVRFELVDVHVIWLGEGRFTLAGFERKKNDAGQAVDFAQSWLCSLDTAPIPELVLPKMRNVRPQT